MTNNTDELDKWQTLSSKTLHQTPWLSVIEDEYRVNDHQSTYTYIKRLNSCDVIAETEDGKLYLVQQYRYPIKKAVWQFPAEGIEDHESWQKCAERCLQEEVGFEAEKWQELGEIYTDPGTLDQVTRWYLATDLSKTDIKSKIKTEQSEFEQLQVKAFSLAEIEQMISDGVIADNWTLAGIYLYQKYKLGN